MLNIGDGILLAGITALVSFALTYGLLRGQVADLRTRVDKLETAERASTGTLATLVATVANMEARVVEAVNGLRRELHASGVFPRSHHGPTE